MSPEKLDALVTLLMLSAAFFGTLIPLMWAADKFEAWNARRWRKRRTRITWL